MAHLSFTLILLPIVLAACTDDSTNANDTPDSGNANTSEPEPSAATDPEPQADDDDEEPGEPSDREGPDGCYLEDSHVCDCDLDEAQCEEVGIWTTGCTSCTAQGALDGGSDSTPDGGAGDGCYDPSAHTCDCATNEPSCTASDGVWTDECGCSGGATHDDAGRVDSGVSTSDAGLGACYLPVNHVCDCSLDETSCEAISGTWTSECPPCERSADAGAVARDAGHLGDAGNE